VKLEWVFLAEGFGRDAKQAITAIGVNQNVHPVQELPATSKRGLFAHISDAEGRLREGDTLSVTLEIKNPSRRTISAQTAELPLGAPTWPDLPLSVDIVTEAAIRFEEFGAYLFSVTLTHVGKDERSESVTGEVELHVKKQPPPTAALEGERQEVSGP